MKLEMMNLKKILDKAKLFDLNLRVDLMKDLYDKKLKIKKLNFNKIFISV